MLHTTEDVGRPAGGQVVSGGSPSPDQGSGSAAEALGAGPGTSLSLDANSYLALPFTAFSDGRATPAQDSSSALASGGLAGLGGGGAGASAGGPGILPGARAATAGASAAGAASVGLPLPLVASRVKLLPSTNSSSPHSAGGSVVSLATPSVVNIISNGKGGGFTWTNSSHPSPSPTNPGSQGTAAGASVSLQISASDPDGDTLSYAVTGLPAGLSINSSTGLISGTVAYSAALAFGGNYSATVIVTDGHGGSASQTFAWTVGETYLTPTVTNPGNQTNAQGNAVSLQISASDPDNDQLTYSATNLPGGLSINSLSGLISGTVTLTAAASSPYTVTVTASDGPLSASQTFTWMITTANQTPQVTAPGNQSNARSDSVSLQIATSDSDGDPLTYTATGLPPGLSIDPASGIISGTVAASAVTSTKR